ncbi:hypothetical protein HYG86_09175 [Alkalicella caledoniensis]|uniref:Uncharacterized protein n=1 Tax=Alkalicella caledoniensis TaxID=2731377 RepID=A0A7G9W8C0_ALKCA|nr:hypothetical protein [Alkalicella caledoniensis]QNO14932.1 hypothetical protein HYG86_09175 [Alkalicella caledoniensis]
MSKLQVYEKELKKLQDIFKDVDPSKAQLVEGLIEDAAFLKAQNYNLKKTIAATGMVKVHPEHPELQKPIETSKQYLKNMNTYAVVIKTLNGVLSKSIIEDDDELEEFE